MKLKLVTINYIIEKYGLSSYMIYYSIKHDSSFPVTNIGPKKNYRIDEDKFEEWFNRKTYTTAYGNEVPTGDDLFKEFRDEK